MSKINLQEPQRNHNATANFVNLIRTNTVHSLEPGETPSYSKLCATFLNIAKYFKTLRFGCGAVAFLSIYLKPVLYEKISCLWQPDPP